MSKLWAPAEMTSATSGSLRRPFHATGISIDTRTIKPGDLFVALVGDNGDGHDHAVQALAKGAAGVMVHRLPDGLPDDAPILQVTDTMVGLIALARFARARFKGRLVAVTGSVGKTTTKNMLRRALSAVGKTWGADASHNNHWGVPLTLARLPADAAYCVVEIGMNHAGEIRPLAELAQPDVAVITTIEKVHIGYLGSLEAIAVEKATLLLALPSDGIAVLPAGTAMLPRLLAAAGSRQHVLFGDGVTAVSDAEGCDVSATIGGSPVRFRLAAPGWHMAMNAVATLTAAHALGADLDIAVAGLDGFAPVAGRGLRRPIMAGAAMLLDESYNASAPSMRAALAVLGLQPATRRMVVLGDMLELGDDGPAEHLGLRDAVLANADLVFACGTLMRPLYDSLPVERQAGFATNSAAIAPIVAAALREGDAVLVKGSLGSKMKLIVDAIELVRVG